MLLHVGDQTLARYGAPPSPHPACPKESGRDHNPRGFSLWMAGGGVRQGFVYGNTDELGCEAVENKVSVTDWHASIPHLLGLDYQRLVFDQNGLKEKADVRI